MRAWRGRPAKHTRGVASVEAAIVVPIMALLLFGLGELGLMLRAGFELNSITRDAARSLSAGEAPHVVALRISEATGSLDRQQMTVTLQFRTYIGNGVWSSTWQTVQANGDENTAPTHSQMRATITYNHRLLLPGLLPFLVDDPARGTRTLTASATMLRS